ncbi:helix-turn-helix domain-containing protein [Companilactobacillus kimchiensis]|uniref:Helix-turn-helix domain-containing protein n=1 Tax=Companilactobacillus kimchiensis TaxID=993692 RepID=A0A0R2L8G8_9LACO|nr:helix-turn-helix transcriptional regulator [Companilactobacillus kimchiensis]KRN98120.1 helix-turn-helix domain-containing protein [Companilactobacillus kimchiensis]
MKFGDHLKQERQKKHLTQQVVADELNVSRQTISSWETENSYPDIESLIRLSDYYQVSLDILLKEDEGMTEYLKKQEIIKRIKPILYILIIIDLLFIGIATLFYLKIIEMNSWTGILLLVIGLLNVLAIFKMSDFLNQLNGKRYTVRYYKVTILGVLLSVIMAVTFAMLKQSLLSGVCSGVAVALIAALVIKFQTKNREG